MLVLFETAAGYAIFKVIDSLCPYFRLNVKLNGICPCWLMELA